MESYLRNLTDSEIKARHKELLCQSWATARNSESPDFATAAEKQAYLHLLGALVDLDREWDFRLMRAFE